MCSVSTECSGNSRTCRSFTAEPVRCRVAGAGLGLGAERSERSALVARESGFLLLRSREPLRFFWLFWTGHDQSP